MPVDATIASTFEYARDWLAASPLLVETLLAGGPEFGNDPERLAAAKARIHQEEVWVEPDDSREAEAAPDLPPSLNPVPRATVMTIADRRRRVGTATFAGSGTLQIVVVALAPEEYKLDHATDTPAIRAEKFRDRRAWAARLAAQIRDELLTESGRSDGAGNPYLNAVSCDPVDPPLDLDRLEGDDGVAWVWEVEWQ